DGVSVSTIEHLMAACAGVGVDNLIVEIDGPEAPIMDGSSALYCRLLLQAGLSAQAAPQRKIRILKPVEVRDGSKFARLTPAARPGDDFELRVRIDFDSAAIGEQTCVFKLSPGAFVSELAFARTFGFAADVEKLKSIGLARGGSLENAVVLDGDAILNPEGLRVNDEFVRHKLLDAIGDLYLAGGLIEGVYEADQPGHAINNTLVRALFDAPDAWEWVGAPVREPRSMATPRSNVLEVSWMGAGA
ncbi:MAG: UDP-3-O-acyl-N-acetylglucosamine deacetylase, partial [Pseudomonadota bacterium]